MTARAAPPPVVSIDAGPSPNLPLVVTVHAGPSPNLPPVVKVDAGPPLSLQLALTPDLDCFRGHFPDCAILPGVAQLDWAVRLGARYLGTSCEVAEISALKFSRVVRPGGSITLILEPTAEGLAFRYRSGEVDCSSGRIACAR